MSLPPEVWQLGTRRIIMGGKTLTGSWTIKQRCKGPLKDYLGPMSHTRHQKTIGIFPISQYRNKLKHKTRMLMKMNITGIKCT